MSELRQSAEFKQGFEEGLEAVSMIRCLEHYTIPQMNKTANGTSECGVCALIEALRLLRESRDRAAQVSLATDMLYATLDTFIAAHPEPSS